MGRRKTICNGCRSVLKASLGMLFALTMMISLLSVMQRTAYAEETATPTPLTFTAQEDYSSVTFSWESGTEVMFQVSEPVGTFIKIDGQSISTSEYALNHDSTPEDWLTYPAGAEIILANINDSVSFKGNDVETSNENHFEMSGKLAASGDVTSLINGEGGDTTLPESNSEGGACYWMFADCASLTSAPELPATTLTNYCYYQMFAGCTGLTSAPVLPATSLAKSCYSHMFDACTGLTAAPKLPATTLANSCYYYMFSGCSSLMSAPVLPATTLANSCYAFMFLSCTGLTSAPDLPATTLAECCYKAMFEGCTGLTAAPDLPATTLANNCYDYMFANCTGLDITDERDFTHKVAWSIPSTASKASDWNKDMFYGCTDVACSATGPVIGTTYYQEGDGKSKTYSASNMDVTLWVPNDAEEPAIDENTTIQVIDSDFAGAVSGVEWYIVKAGQEVETLESFVGNCNDVNIILEDGGSLTLNYDYIIQNADYNLTIWGQEAGTGKLTIISHATDKDVLRCKNMIVNGGTLSFQVENYMGVGGTTIDVESYQQNDGCVEIDNESELTERAYYNKGISARSSIDIKGGTLTISMLKGSPIMSSTGDIRITGGTVTTSVSDTSDYWVGITAVSGSVVIRDASVNTSGIWTGNIYGSSDESLNITILDSTLSVTMGYDESAIYAVGNLLISGSDVTVSNPATGKNPTISAKGTFNLNGGISSVYAGTEAPGSLVAAADYASLAKENNSYHYVRIQSTVHHYDYENPIFTWSEDGKTCQVSYACLDRGCTSKISYDCEVTSELKKDATCTATGLITYTATCNRPLTTVTDTKNVTVAKKSHTVKDGLQNVKAATCTTAGYTGDIVCSVCGEIITKGKTVAAKGHIAKSGLQNVKAATCTTEGYTGDTVCSVCGEIITKGKTIAAKGHSYKNVLTKATTTVNGKIVKKCSVCGNEDKKSTMVIYRPKTLTLSAESFVYTGRVKKPTVSIKDTKGKVIDAKYYKLTYSKGLKNVGTYTVTVTFKGNYSGKLTKTYRILPKTTTIAKLTAVSKGFTLTWKKQTSQTTGYELSYSTSKAFKSAKTVQITKNTTLTKKITKLTAKKKYYVRIRTYKTVGKVTYYSEWSAAQTVTTKK